MNGTKTYNLLERSSAVFLILALLWLTVSAPFVFAAQQHLQEQQASSYPPECQEDSGNPFSNSTEEKAPSSSVSEEFLHDQEKYTGLFSLISRYHSNKNDDTYLAFHGELLVPPPNVG